MESKMDNSKSQHGHVSSSSTSSVSTPDSVRSKRRSLDYKTESRSLSSSFASSQLGLGHSNGLQLGNSSPTISPFSQSRFRRRSASTTAATTRSPRKTERPKSFAATADSEDSDPPLSRPRSRRQRLQRSISPKTGSNETLKQAASLKESPAIVSPTQSHSSGEDSYDSSPFDYLSDQPPDSNFTSPLHISAQDEKRLHKISRPPPFRAVPPQRSLPLSTVPIRKFTMKDIMPTIRPQTDATRSAVDFFETHSDYQSESDESEMPEYLDAQFKRVWDRFQSDVCGGRDPSSDQVCSSLNLANNEFDFDVNKAFIQAVSLFVTPSVKPHFENIKVREFEKWTKENDKLTDASAHTLYESLLRATLAESNDDWQLRVQNVQSKLSDILDHIELESGSETLEKGRVKSPVIAVLPGNYQQLVAQTTGRSPNFSSGYGGYESPSSMSASSRDPMTPIRKARRSVTAPRMSSDDSIMQKIRHLSTSFSESDALARLAEDAQSPAEMLEIAISAGKEQGLAERKYELDSRDAQISALEKKIADEKLNVGGMMEDLQIRFDSLLESAQDKDKKIAELEQKLVATTASLREQEALYAESQNIAETATNELSRMTRSARDQETQLFSEKQKLVDLELEVSRTNGALAKKNEELAELKGKMRPLCEEIEAATAKLEELDKSERIIAEMQKQLDEKNEHVERLNSMIEDLQDKNRTRVRSSSRPARSLEAELMAGGDFLEEEFDVEDYQDDDFVREIHKPELNRLETHMVDSEMNTVHNETTGIKSSPQASMLDAETLTMSESRAETVDAEMMTDELHVKTDSLPVKWESYVGTHVETEPIPLPTASRSVQTEIVLNKSQLSQAVQTEAEKSIERQPDKAQWTGSSPVPAIDEPSNGIRAQKNTLSRAASSVGLRLPQPLATMHLRDVAGRALFYGLVLWLVAVSTMLTREIFLWHEANSVVSSTLATVVHGESGSASNIFFAGIPGLTRRLVFSTVQLYGNERAVV